MQLSPKAVEALINVGTNRQGASIWKGTNACVVNELRELRLIGSGGGLTRRGTIKRQQLMLAVMDELF
jgi:hypothetical protein